MSRVRPRTLGSLALAGFLAVAAFGSDAAADVLHGRVLLMDSGGKRPARGEDPSRIVVWFEPASGTESRSPVTEEIVTLGKDFAPKVLAVPTGSRVEFPNRDPILHNVFSVSSGNAFDLGFVRRGESGEVVFRKPGVVKVFCNVHQDMVSHVVVLDTRWFAHASDDGSFRLAGVPSGPGRLHVWYERSDERILDVEPGQSPVEVRLEITQPRVPPHMNKFGRRYGRSRSRY